MLTAKRSQAVGARLWESSESDLPRDYASPMEYERRHEATISA